MSDLSLVYILLIFTMLGSCSGPSRDDVQKLTDEIKEVKAQIQRCTP